MATTSSQQEQQTAQPSPSSSSPPPSSSSQPPQQPGSMTLTDFISNPAVCDMLSFLIAKLETLKYDVRTSLFRTQWAKNLFYKGLQELRPQAGRGWFDVDTWYRLMKTQAQRQGERYIETDMLSADISTNWIDPLFKIEQTIPGFLRLFHSVLLLEDNAHAKMSTIVDHNKNGYDDTTRCNTHPALTYR